MQGLEQLLRMWGVSPGSQRWQDMMRDFERGQTLFNQVLHQDPTGSNITTAVSVCLHESIVWEYHIKKKGPIGRHWS